MATPNRKETALFWLKIVHDSLAITVNKFKTYKIIDQCRHLLVSLLQPNGNAPAHADVKTLFGIKYTNELKHKHLNTHFHRFSFTTCIITSSLK